MKNVDTIRVERAVRHAFALAFNYHGQHGEINESDEWSKTVNIPIYDLNYIEYEIGVRIFDDLKDLLNSINKFIEIAWSGMNRTTTKERLCILNHGAIIRKDKHSNSAIDESNILYSISLVDKDFKRYTSHAKNDFKRHHDREIKKAIVNTLESEIQRLHNVKKLLQYKTL